MSVAVITVVLTVTYRGDSEQHAGDIAEQLESEVRRAAERTREQHPELGYAVTDVDVAT